VTLGNQYGRGSGTIWLDEVECVGYEASIGECRHNAWGVHNCGHGEDVSISCYALDDSELCSVFSLLCSAGASKGTTADAKCITGWGGGHKLLVPKKRKTDRQS